jgi:uncharacterized protein (TIGR02588 family)
MAKRRPRRIPPAEWMATLISLGIVLATIGFLMFEAFQPGPLEPALTVDVLQVRESAGSFVVDVEVKNASRGAAADVHLAGMSETRPQARVDYVPGFSSRRASLVFAFDPGNNAEVRIVGYSQP